MFVCLFWKLFPDAIMDTKYFADLIKVKIKTQNALKLQNNVRPSDKMAVVSIFSVSFKFFYDKSDFK